MKKLFTVLLFCMLASLHPYKMLAQTYPTISLSVYLNTSFWDNWRFIMKPGTSELSGDNGDLTKISNAQFDIYSLSTDNVSLNFDARASDSIADGDVLHLGIRSLPLYTFTLVAAIYTIPDNRSVYLHDNYTNSTILLGPGVSYPFSITSDAASQGNSRLSLIFVDSKYYSAASGKVDSLGTYGLNTDGTGKRPASFAASNKEFHIANNNPGILGADWTVSGTNSKVVADTSLVITGHNVNAKLTMAAGKKLTVAAGSTLTTNDSLVLMPGARIGNLAGTITGGAVVKSQLTAQRAYRLIGHPFTTNKNIATLGSAFDITGLTAGNLGICFSTNPSVFSYTAGTVPAYVGITATGANTFPAAGNGNLHANGVLAFVRGASGEGCNVGIYSPSVVTITTAGTLNTGGVTETVPANGWNLISNPLPSPIVLSGVTGYTDLYAAKVILPQGQNSGVPYYNGTQYVSASANTVIPINGAFLAYNNTGADITLTFPETAKTDSTVTAGVLKTTSIYPMLELSVYYQNYFWDNWDLILQPGARKAAHDKGDLDKMSNAQFDLYSLSEDNASLNIDARSADSIADGDVVRLGIRSLPYNTYTLATSQYSIPTDKMVYLHDKYTNSYTLLGNGSNYQFSVNSDAASQGQNRMELVFYNVNNTTGVGAVSAAPAVVTVSPNPATANITVNYSNDLSGAKNITLLDMVGRVVRQASTTGSAVTIAVADLAPGVYFIKTLNGNNTSTTRFVKN